MCTFIEKCVSGTAQPDEVDYYIDQWHTGYSDLPLHTYLGMSWEEYKTWVESPDSLPLIVYAHKP
jgi:hypothetical protein